MGLPQHTSETEGFCFTLGPSTRTRVVPRGIAATWSTASWRRAGRSKRQPSGSRSTPRRCASGVTGSWPTGRPVVGSVVSAAAIAEQNVPAGTSTVIRFRKRQRWGASHIAHETGLASSTVPRILNGAGLGRLDRGDRATVTPVRRYQRDRPGELIHVDIKKIAAIPAGGGWRLHGRGNDGHGGQSGVGYRLHPLRARRSNPARVLRAPPRPTSRHPSQVRLRANHWFNTAGTQHQLEVPRSDGHLS